MPPIMTLKAAGSIGIPKASPQQPSNGHGFLPLATPKSDPTVSHIELTEQDKDGNDDFGFWNICVHQVIREHCLKSPDSPAVHAWDGSFTYAELNRLSDGIASILNILGVKRETIVPICMQKSRWTTVAIMGVLKSGGAFSLLDPSYPQSRLEEMCKELQASFILASEVLSEKCSQFASALVVEHLNSAWLLSPRLAWQAPSRPEDSAYVAFTSGSTGKPKGIVIEHRSYCSGARSHLKVFGIDSTSRVLQFASYAFDVSIMETLSTLMAGACLCVMSEAQRCDPNLFVESYKTLRISHAFMTPSFARTVPWKDCSNPPPTLIVGGELMRPSDAVAYSELGIRCMNAYGPAECSVNVSVQPKVKDGVHATNIGFTTGSTAWIVSQESPEQLVPPGAVGELLVEGPIVGRCYLNNPSATRLAFIEPPSWLRQHRKGANYHHRVYRTGDLASYDIKTGALLLHGRKDAQVKIRGQRVELHEIEHHLQQTFRNRGVEVIVEKVTFTEDDLEKLFAFILMPSNVSTLITDNREDCLFLPPQPSDVKQFKMSKQHLQSCLPTYMIPDIFVPITFVPQTPSGKTDRKTLRARAANLSKQEIQRFSLSATAAKTIGIANKPPITQEESKIRSLYSKVLHIPVDLIAMNDTFLRLGGDSLQAIQLVAAARTAGITIHAADILSSQTTLAEQSKRATFTQIPDHAEDAQRPFALLPMEQTHEILDIAQRQCRVSSKLLEDIYPCTPAQEGMFLTSLKHPGMYTGQITLGVPDDVELPRLRAAWLSVAYANPALRTRMIQTQKGLMQAVIAEDFAWEAEEAGRELCHNSRGSEISSIGVPLVRFRYDHDSRQLIMTIHHSIWDGWSLRLMHEQLERAYTEQRSLMRTSYRSFIQYTQALHGVEEFWASEFAGLNAPIFPTLPSCTYQASAQVSLRHVVKDLVSSGMGEHTTATYIHLAWSLLIAHYTDSDETVYGVTVNGRNAFVPGIENILGPTIATVPLRILINRENTVKVALDHIQGTLARMIPYEQAGLQRISRCSEDAAKGCKFQTLLIIEAPADGDIPHTNGKAGNFPILGGTTQTGMDYTAFSPHAMMVVFRPNADKTVIAFDITYDAQVVSSAEVERISYQFEHVLRQVYKLTGEKIGDITLAGPRDLEQIRAWNRNMPLADERFLQDLVFAQCLRRPHARAVASWDGSWTYEELLSWSSFFASELQTHGVKRGTPVAVCLERSRWSIAAILAILLAGGTCVLIDLRSPGQRIQEILQIVGATVLINDKKTALVTSGLSRTEIDVSFLANQRGDRQGENTLEKEIWKNPAGNPEDLAFIMFTSGSTGRPKGIEMPHRTLASSICYHTPCMKVHQNSRVLHFSSYAFDVSIYEIFTTLAAGGTICVPSEVDRMNNLAGFINEAQVNWAFLTPSAARSLKPSDVPSLTTLVLGGEAVTHESVEAWAKGRSLINGYGPAEATICGLGDIPETGWKSGVIGQIVGGLGWITVPSDPTRLAAVGAIGELLLEGPFLARGYLNLPEVTNTAFIGLPDWRNKIPAPSPYKQIYRTGDLVSYQDDGSIRYIGRKDSRIKLRGQLVDLSAVEASVVRVYPSATQVVADVINSGSTTVLTVLMKLSSHVTETRDDGILGKPDSTFSEAASFTQAQLRAIVPPYMVPSMFIPLRQVPRTLTGKTDRRQLREKLLALSRADLQSYNMTYSTKVPVSDENEQRLQEIWADVLQLPCEEIGRDDSFLLLGGESLAAMKVVAQARRVGFDFSVAEVLNNTILSVLARSRNLISGHDEPNQVALSSSSIIQTQNCQQSLQTLRRSNIIQEDDDILAIHPASAAQALLIQRYPWSHFQFDLSGNIDIRRLREACALLISRFDILRTVFVEHEDRILQIMLGNLRDCVHEIRTDEPLESFCEALCKKQQCFPVVSSPAPPTLFTLVSHHQLNRHRLLLRLSHAQYDIITIPILVDTLANVYNRTADTTPSSQFSHFINHQARQSNDTKASTFWQKYLSGSSMTPALQSQSCSNSEDMEIISQVTGSCNITLGPILVGITLATAVKAAVCLVLASRTGRTDIVVGQTVDCRSSSPHGDLDQIVGPCTNYIPYRLNVCYDQVASEYLLTAHTQHTTSLSYSSLDLNTIVSKSTTWPNSSHFNYVVQHQTVNTDLTLSLGNVVSLPMTSCGRIFPQSEVWIGSTPHASGLKIDIIGLSTVISQKDAQSLAEQVCMALSGLLHRDDRPISDFIDNTSAW
ncbi:Nonribosomal peptide synthetase 13 [Penicillium brasilianum]|uniref:Brevianamide F synthase n=1 Tax=Penicillium brasilianum TaxID=104259 RepID=A0A1S9S122_PENBI|nr:Nonribosomal peptide synthetase 13 [Penicillium brasilianum]